MFPVCRESSWTTAPRQTSQSGNTSAASRRRAVGRRRTALCTIYCWTENKYQLQHISAALSCQRLSDGAVYICGRSFILKDSFVLVSNLDNCVEIWNKHRNQKAFSLFILHWVYLFSKMSILQLYFEGASKLIHFCCQKSWIHRQKSEKSADFKNLFAHRPRSEYVLECGCVKHATVGARRTGTRKAWSSK